MYQKQLQALAAAGRTRTEVVEGPGGLPVELQVPIDLDLPESVIASMIAEQLQAAIGRHTAQAQNPQAEGGVAGAVGGRGRNLMAELLRGAA